MEATEKFSKDGPFNDPVVRCDGCQRLLLVAELNEMGMCKHCSNTRVKNVRAGNSEDWGIMQRWAKEGLIDTDFLKLFEGRKNG